MFPGKPTGLFFAVFPAFGPSHPIMAITTRVQVPIFTVLEHDVFSKKMFSAHFETL